MSFHCPHAEGLRDSEIFVNPRITSVKIDIDGVPNKVYLNGMMATDLWQSIIKRVVLVIQLRKSDFYTDKFALWIDLRIYPDNDIHGNGLYIHATRDGVTLEINREKVGTKVLTCYLLLLVTLS